eukprot:gnl/Hemi2/22086_TR7358_c0_g1_i1.p1 gnl/Hemi2/22086_TR7358_c0_g1~~gnl/Hemi2/22086_TR7358_c0_g1_i1.p1  ORF type:complete len:349 (+),score=87.93 gnl/Hemi2/22086_TR7358_c0_g1_i1:50-1096(+)
MRALLLLVGLALVVAGPVPDPKMFFSVTGPSEISVYDYQKNMTGFYLEPAVGDLSYTIYANSPTDELTTRFGPVGSGTVMSNSPVTIDNLPMLHTTLISPFWSRPWYYCNASCVINCTQCLMDPPVHYYVRFNGSRDATGVYRWTVPSVTKMPYAPSGLHALSTARYMITDRSATTISVQWQSAEAHDGEPSKDLLYSFGATSNLRVNTYTPSGWKLCIQLLDWQTFGTGANFSTLTTTLDTSSLAHGTYQLCLAVKDHTKHMSLYYPTAESLVLFSRSTAGIWILLWVLAAIMLAGTATVIGYVYYRRRQAQFAQQQQADYLAMTDLPYLRHSPRPNITVLPGDEEE